MSQANKKDNFGRYWETGLLSYKFILYWDGLGSRKGDYTKRINTLLRDYKFSDINCCRINVAELYSTEYR